MSPQIAILIAASASVAFAGAIDFSRDIQPILSENCFHCHGPDAQARKAELRLDQREGAMRVQDGVAVVKPGDSKASALIERIFTADAEDVMPPIISNRTLTTAQKELLRRWVDEGAKWGEHWAFVAPKRPEVPGIADCGMRIADCGSGNARARARCQIARTAGIIGKRCTARFRDESEMRVLLARLGKLRESYAQDADAARNVSTIGESKRDETLPVAELAAWTGIASVVLNLDETLSNE